MSITETFIDIRPFTTSAATRVKIEIVSVVSWLRGWIRNRRAMQDLMEMEEWQLNDIGLTRSDLGFVSHHPFFDNPSRQLDKIARNKGSEV